MRILHNLASLSAYKSYTKNLSDESISMGKISSGYEISKASDNPNGLSKSEKMKVQIAGLNMAAQNVQDGVSMMQTMDGGLGGITDLIQRIRELTVEANNGTNTGNDINDINAEISQLSDGVNDIVNNTEFNGKKLLSNTSVTDNSNPKIIGMQSGANSGDSINIPMYNLAGVGTQFHPLKSDGTVDYSKYFNVNLSQIDLNTGSIKSTDGSFTVSGLNLQNIQVYNSDGSYSNNLTSQQAADAIEKNVGSSSSAFSALNLEDNAINTVISVRGTYGAISNRFQSSYDDLNAISDKIQGAESGIQDVDIAKEIMNYSKDNVLVQAGEAIMAQTNKFPQEVLSILENVK